MRRNEVLWIVCWLMLVSTGQAAEPPSSDSTSLPRIIEQDEWNCEFDGESLDLTESAGSTQDGRLAELKTTAPRLQALTIHRSAITDDGLKHLAALLELRSLTIELQPNLLPHQGLGDAALQHLVGLKKLECLSLSAQKVTHEGMAQLRHLPNLRRLNLNLGCQTESFARRSQTLGLLGNSRPTLSGMSLVHIGKLKRLEKLTLAGYSFSNDDLRLLRGMSQLRSLDLAFTDVDDEAIMQLPGFEHLEVLNLYGTRTTPQGVAHLTTLKNVRVSGWGKSRLTVRTDDCFVHWLASNVLHTNRSTGEMTHLARDQRVESPRDRMGQLPGTRVNAQRVRVIKHDDQHVYLMLTTTSGVRHPFATELRNDIASATIYAYRLSDAQAVHVWKIPMQPQESVQDFVRAAIQSFSLSDGGVTCLGKQFRTMDNASKR